MSKHLDCNIVYKDGRQIECKMTGEEMASISRDSLVSHVDCPPIPKTMTSDKELIEAKLGNTGYTDHGNTLAPLLLKAMKHIDMIERAEFINGDYMDEDSTRSFACNTNVEIRAALELK